MYTKLLYLETEQKNALEDIKKKVKKNGGKVSVMRLIQDAIKIFVEHYRYEAIEKYSSSYSKKY
jgi:hypothetical protein